MKLVLYPTECDVVENVLKKNLHNNHGRDDIMKSVLRMRKHGYSSINELPKVIHYCTIESAVELRSSDLVSGQSMLPTNLL